MPILVDKETSHYTISIHGKFDATLAEEARTIFSQLLQEVNEDVHLEMSNVDSIDSSGIGAIVFLFKRLRETNHNLTLEGLRNQPYDIIKLLHIDRIIKVVPHDSSLP